MPDIFAPFGAPQKALHLHLEEAKKSPKHLGHEYMIFEKYDGWFMYVDCINGVWQDHLLFGMLHEDFRH